MEDYETKLQVLKVQQEEFEELNLKLCKHLDPKHDYLTKLYYEQYKKRIEAYSTKIHWGLLNPLSDFPTMEQMNIELSIQVPTHSDAELNQIPSQPPSEATVWKEIVQTLMKNTLNRN